MPRISPLEGWLLREAPLEGLVDLETGEPNLEHGGFLGLDLAVPLHESLDLPAESLAEAWEKTHAYVRAALTKIDSEYAGWIDSEEVDLIRTELGDPPHHCYPIYVMSVADATSERVVYIGKTSSRQGRFRGGHAAITKLHNPVYDGLVKRLYLGTVTLISNDGRYLPLEWVKPLARAEEVLGSVEAQLIRWFSPELNTQHVAVDNSKWPVTLHIQNFSGLTEFLDDEFCYARPSDETT